MEHLFSVHLDDLIILFNSQIAKGILQSREYGDQHQTPQDVVSVHQSSALPRSRRTCSDLSELAVL
jgi:hypothetical protein